MISPAFVGLFYLSANHIKFTYLIKEIKMKKILIIALLIVGCAPKIKNSYVGMTEQKFNKEKLT